MRRDARYSSATTCPDPRDQLGHEEDGEIKPSCELDGLEYEKRDKMRFHDPKAGYVGTRCVVSGAEPPWNRRVRSLGGYRYVQRFLFLSHHLPCIVSSCGPSQYLRVSVKYALKFSCESFCILTLVHFLCAMFCFVLTAVVLRLISPAFAGGPAYSLVEDFSGANL